MSSLPVIPFGAKLLGRGTHVHPPGTAGLQRLDGGSGQGAATVRVAVHQTGQRLPAISFGAKLLP
jgi:hypothetical protein